MGLRNLVKTLTCLAIKSKRKKTIVKNYKAENVEDYIASSEPEARPKLEELRDLVKSTIPKADEGISWGVPFYKYHGMLAGFAPFKNHVSIWFPTMRLETEDRKILEQKGYTTKEKTILIKYDQKVPTAELKKLLKDLAKINENQRG